MSDDLNRSKQAFESDDPYALAQSASTEELERLKAAESLLQLKRERVRSASRFQLASQVLVGYVAVLGLLVNAYQSFTNKKQQEQQQMVDQERWSREFQRAQESDKYRAFFETSILATDEQNRDKRMVGYALLEEFIEDARYNSKAALMLEESLYQELKRHKREVIDEDYQNALVAIISALSYPKDCVALERSANTIERVVQHRSETGHNDEATQLFGLYIRKIVGRATQYCGTLKEFQRVLTPLQQSLRKTPQLGGFTSSLSALESNVRIAQIFRSDCLEEALISGSTSCPESLRGWQALCAVAKPTDETSAKPCEVIGSAVEELPKVE